MKSYSFFIALFLFFSSNVMAQKVITHKVKSGESIYAIAKKYDVTEKEIYENNPKLKGAVLGLNDEIKIPNKKYKAEPKKELAVAKKSKPGKEITASPESLPSHLVQPKETLYSISKKYNLSIDAITELNPEINNGGLKAGMVLQLAGFDGNLPTHTEKNVTLNELPKETKDKTKVVVAEHKVVETKIEQPKIAEPKIADANSNGDVIHKIQPKETLYRISKAYNVSIDELTKLNPTVASGLPVGYELIVKKGFTDKTVVASAPQQPEIAKEIEFKPLSVDNLSKAEFLIAKASENLGTRYRSGGTTPAGFDCSGLMFSTFKNIDMTLPRSSHDMAKYGQRIDRSQAQKGDLIFFATFGGGRVSHVGMVTEVHDDEIKFIHSSTQAGVIISSTKENYYSRTFVQVNRVLAQ